MTDFVISERLKQIAGFIKKGSRVVDIGTDHGYLPIYLVKEEISTEVIAVDLRKSPLTKAEKNAEDYKASDFISFRISDGFDKISADEYDTAVICGMGGFVIIRMLEKAILQNNIKIGKEFVLSPHSDKEAFRKFLYENGFKIVEEIITSENNWFYNIFHCIYDGIKRSTEKIFYRYGELPLKQKQMALKDYLTHERGVLLKVEEALNLAGTDEAAEKLKITKMSVELNEKALEYFD